MNLFFRKKGKGPPLVFLHGLLGMSDHWVGISMAFEKDYTVYLPDLRNHGKSFHSDIFNYKIMCDDLIELFTKNNIREAVIVGHSMGGKLAMQFADSFPEMVKLLVVAEIGIEKYSPALFEELLEEINAIDVKSLKNRQQVNDILTGMKLEKRLVQLLLKNISFDAQGTACWKFYLNAIRANLNEIHKKIELRNMVTQPTLFIYGGHSDFIRSTDFPEIKKYFSDVNFFKMENTSHWLHADDPATFIREIKAFLRS